MADIIIVSGIQFSDLLASSDKSWQEFPTSFSPGGNTLLMNSEPTNAVKEE